MNNSVVVITLSRAHVHYCQALISSIRHYHPELPIIILKDGNFSMSWVKKIDNLYFFDSEKINQLHGLDLYVLLNKLNILWLPELGFKFEYYIHIDADSILTGNLNSIPWKDSSDFYILQGQVINFQDEGSKKNLIKYAFDPMNFPEFRFNLDKLFYFSASHIIVSKRFMDVLREDVKKYRTELEKELINQKRFKFNDQGFLNCMINKYYADDKIKVTLHNKGIYGYQSSGDYPLLILENVRSHKNTDVLFIHYTASARKLFINDHNFGSILIFLYKKFYRGQIQRYYINEVIRLLNYFTKKVNRRLNYELNKLKGFFKNGN